MSKLICPNCGSEKLTYFKEFCTIRYYLLDKNNNPTKKCTKKKEDSCNMPENWQCLDCGYIFGGTANIQCAYKGGLTYDKRTSNRKTKKDDTNK